MVHQKSARLTWNLRYRRRYRTRLQLRCFLRGIYLSYWSWQLKVFKSVEYINSIRHDLSKVLNQKDWSW